MSNATFAPATTAGVRTASSKQKDAQAAVAELRSQLTQPDLKFVQFHCSPAYDRTALAAALAAAFPGVPMIGCTTAGEITPDGYGNGSITAFSLAGPDFTAEIVRLDDLRSFTVARGDAAGRTALAALRARGVAAAAANTFGLLLIDGMSVREEGVVSSLYHALGGIQMIGGSAGDEISFGKTWIYHDGAFRNDTAVFALVHTTRAFRVLQTQHFDFTDGRMVVTSADIGQRIVREINGLPAGREYARMVGLKVDQLTPMIFAAHPVVVRINGQPYVRSIAKVNADESLSFFCAIDEGIVLTVARQMDMVDRLRQCFAGVQRELGPPAITIGCDCILRYLEMQQKHVVDQISALLRDNHVIGFATYGEQYNGMHVNQTFTGIAIAAPR